MKYGDAVVFVQKQGDGSLRRVNAIVLASSVHGAVTADRKPVLGSPKEEHLDLAFPVMSLVPDGQVLKTRNLEEIFRPAYDVRPWADGAWVGWEKPVIGFGAAAAIALGLTKSSGIDGDAGDWTQAGMDATGFPVVKGSAEDVTAVEKVEQPVLPSADDLDVVAAEQKVKQDIAKVPFDELTDEQKADTIFPTWDGIVTSSGKTQEQLDADHAAQQS